MEYQRIAGTKLAVSALSLGTWAFSGAKVWGENDDRESVRTIHCALEHGVTLIDTAERYGGGRAETVVGEALAGRRGQAVLATKAYSDCLAADALIQSCEESLRRLKTDYIDLYQIHWPSAQVPLEETFGAMQKLIEAGKVRAVSVCNFGPQSLAQAAGRPLALNQVPWSLVWRAAEAEIIPASVESGIGIWAYSPLGQGLLTGKYRTLDDVPLNRRETRLYSSGWRQGRHSGPGFEREVFALLDGLRGLCGEYGCTMAGLAFAFLKAQPALGSILVGARSSGQLLENLEAFSAPVPAEAVRRARELSEPLREAVGTNADPWEDKDGGRIR